MKKTNAKKATPVAKKKKVAPATSKVTVKKAPANTTVKVKMKRISKSKALDLIVNNKGRFFAAEFIDKKNTPRVMNCLYLKNQGTNKLGYVKVKEAALMRTAAGIADPKKTIRQLNMQTLYKLKIGGVQYKIN
ncbi:MAG TPA: hypothetical protein PLG47_05105 [Candidatus Dojkabacteria bacterium]|nr:hypothetical protein [Candidatus Dojkabacteria bacterium]